MYLHKMMCKRSTHIHYNNTYTYSYIRVSPSKKLHSRHQAEELRQLFRPPRQKYGPTYIDWLAHFSSRWNYLGTLTNQNYFLRKSSLLSNDASAFFSRSDSTAYIYSTIYIYYAHISNMYVEGRNIMQSYS